MIDVTFSKVCEEWEIRSQHLKENEIEEEKLSVRGRQNERVFFVLIG